MRPFALALLASASLAGPALAGGPPATPTVSGLAWLSGSTEGDGSDCLALLWQFECSIQQNQRLSLNASVQLTS